MRAEGNFAYRVGELLGYIVRSITGASARQSFLRSSLCCMTCQCESILHCQDLDIRTKHSTMKNCLQALGRPLSLWLAGQSARRAAWMQASLATRMPF